MPASLPHLCFCPPLSNYLLKKLAPPPPPQKERRKKRESFSHLTLHYITQQTHIPRPSVSATKGSSMAAGLGYITACVPFQESDARAKGNHVYMILLVCSITHWLLHKLQHTALPRCSESAVLHHTLWTLVSLPICLA